MGIIALDPEGKLVLNAYGDVLVFQNREHAEQELETAKYGAYTLKRLVKVQKSRKKKPKPK